MNPMALMGLKASFDKFQNNHPRFIQFAQVIAQVGLKEGTVLFSIQEKNQKPICAFVFALCAHSGALGNDRSCNLFRNRPSSVGSRRLYCGGYFRFL